MSVEEGERLCLRMSLISFLLVLFCSSNVAAATVFDSGRAFYGFTVGYDPLSAAERESIDALLADFDAQVERVSYTWRDLAPARGQVELAEITANLERNKERGVATMVSVTVIDSGGVDTELPAFFVNESSPFQIAEPWTAMAAEFNALVDVLVPIMEANDAFVFIIGNEPQFYFEDIGGNAEQIAEQVVEFLTFFEIVRDHLHSLTSIPISLTLANHNMDGALETGVVELSDVVTMNNYGSVDGGNPDVWRASFDELHGRFKPLGKAWLLQETGLSTLVDGATEEDQVAFIEMLTAFKRESLQSEAPLVASFWFLMHDPKEQFLDYSVAALVGVTSPEFVQKTRNELGGLGLCRFNDDGECVTKAGWSAFLDGEQSFSSSAGASDATAETVASTDNDSQATPSDGDAPAPSSAASLCAPAFALLWTLTATI